MPGAGRDGRSMAVVARFGYILCVFCVSISTFSGSDLLSGELMSIGRGVLVVDSSISSLSGSSQQLLPFNSSRCFLLIYNSGTAAIAVNLTGGTAAINTQGSITIQPTGSINYNTGAVPSNTITVIGTSGQTVTCLSCP